ncbi:MAG: hypothetical protein JOZ10_00035 [Acidobacteria bacterium]|nr:hypothetical protein [Acidobacteriota bacterium]MBV9144507.1 hypothetical protein [Acidobacteriota bacterium]MBV9434550.1 hypothetical protein [Acidobacteriota bacterium]
MGDISPVPSSEPPRSADPRRNLFWLFVSFMGISIPHEAQQRRAMMFLIIGVVIFLAFVAAGLFTIFRFW